MPDKMEKRPRTELLGRQRKSQLREECEQKSAGALGVIGHVVIPENSPFQDPALIKREE